MKHLTIEIKELKYFYEFEFKFIKNKKEIISYFRFFKNQFMILFGFKLLNELIALCFSDAELVFSLKEFDNLIFKIKNQSFNIINNDIVKEFDIIPQTIFLEIDC